MVGLGVSLATAALMLATEPSMAIGWDEGYTLGREERLARLVSWPARSPSVCRRLAVVALDLELVQEADKMPHAAAAQLDSR